MQEAVLHHTAGTADTSAAEPAHDPQALRALSQQALAAGRLEEARQWAEQARAAAPEHDLHTALHLAAVMHRQQDLAGAEAVFRALLPHHPKHPAPAQRLSALLLQQGRVEEAYRLARQARDLAPQDLGAALNLARAATQADDPGEAEQVLEEILVRDPGNRAALHQLTDLALRQSRRSEARQWAERAVAAAPEDIGTILKLAQVLQAQNDLDGAKQRVEAALALVPQDLNVLRRLCDIAIRQNDLPAARGYMERVLQQAEQDTNAHLRLVEILLRSRDFAAAQKAVTRMQAVFAPETLAPAPAPTLPQPARPQNPNQNQKKKRRR
ncbi:tetratricopeptide repeat protein [Roseomonas mucosa]|uniref:tetratricopeptide repeat protein n=1 Tax=Roseomonas mucosa TaxID=207340 RepID=UPI003252FA19